MTQQLVESVPNVSEGRDHTVLTRLTGVIKAVPNVALLDVHVDPNHHRSVFTIVGEPDAMEEALFGFVQEAQKCIDLRQHQGEHPRIGAVDVVPWVPLQGITMEECVKHANHLGSRIGQELKIPVFLYEQACVRRNRGRLEVIRRGGLPALGLRMENEPDWQPDYGPAELHQSAGAIVIGARFFLIAFNVVVQSQDFAIAARIARTIRTSNGGLPSLKAMAVPLHSRNLVQVSMNLTDYRKTSLRQAFEAVKTEGKRYQVDILESEIVGLVPRTAWDGDLWADLKLASLPSDPIIESRLEQSTAFSTF